MADADELVARGYFCVPGWIIEDPRIINPGMPICIETEVFPIGFPPSPLTCGVVGDPIVFEAVPTRPDLSVTKAHGRSRSSTSPIRGPRCRCARSANISSKNPWTW